MSVKNITKSYIMISVLVVVLLFIMLGWSSDCTKLNDSNRENVDAYSEMVRQTDTSTMTDSQHREYIDLMHEWSNSIEDSQSKWQSKCG